LGGPEAERSALAGAGLAVAALRPVERIPGVGAIKPRRSWLCFWDVVVIVFGVSDIEYFAARSAAF